METTQVNGKERRALNEIMFDLPDVVYIPGTRRKVEVSGLHPYTLERLTQLWVERDARRYPEDSAETLKSMCIEPYFAIKEACLFVLNGFWKIKLLYPLMWRIWAYIREYTEEQVQPIIEAAKKKVPLTSHWMNMAYSVDMRVDWKKMTEKEAEQYRQELISAAKQLSSNDSQSTESIDGV